LAQTADVSTIKNKRRPAVCSPVLALRSVTTPAIGAAIVYGFRLSLLSISASF
jgi:hypothetical protein